MRHLRHMMLAGAVVALAAAKDAGGPVETRDPAPAGADPVETLIESGAAEQTADERDAERGFTDEDAARMGSELIALDVALREHGSSLAVVLAKAAKDQTGIVIA